MDLQISQPQELGLCPHKWNRVLKTAAELCQSNELPALSLQVQRLGRTTGSHHFGTSTLESQTPVNDQTLFLVASLTKPIVAMAVVLLVERGLICLNQPVYEIIPEFKEAAKRQITIRHLLTHTSGLPDMLPNNQQLRQAGASLTDFVKETCQTELLNPPGRTAQYQSMGFTLLGEMIFRVTGLTCRDFLQSEFFGPLKMNQTWLGIPADLDSQKIAEIDLPESQRAGTTWNWNSSYWRELGAPWGGLITTTADLSRYLQMMIRDGLPNYPDRILSRFSIQQSLENRLADFPAISDSEVRSRGWGLGWRLNWKDHRASFCDLLPVDVAGHWGASGTLFWMDRRREMGVVLLSTRPLTETVSPLARLSNMIAAAFVEG